MHLKEKELAAHMIAVGHLMLEHGQTRREVEEELESATLLQPYLERMQRNGVSQERSREMAGNMYHMHDADKPRDPVAVMDEMIESVKSKSDFRDFIEHLKELKTRAAFRAPELVHHTWEELYRYLLTCLPSNDSDTMSAAHSKLIRIFTKRTDFC